MIVVYVAVKTRDGQERKFEHIIDDIQAQVRQMTGCVKYEWFRDLYTAGRYVVYGEFESREHFDTYLKSPIVERIGAELIPLLDGQPAFKHYHASEFDGR
jgi:quinol monooxygenase YgiN